MKERRRDIEARYKSFVRVHGYTYNKNIGTMFQPFLWSDACECEES